MRICFSDRNATCPLLLFNITNLPDVANKFIQFFLSISRSHPKKKSVLPLRFFLFVFYFQEAFSDTFHLFYICAIQDGVLIFPPPMLVRRQASFFSLISALFSLYPQNMYCWMIQKKCSGNSGHSRKGNMVQKLSQHFLLILAFFGGNVGFVVGRSTA